jgi:RNA polymerase subunit RPABC4/transcription elongation factor Spt4
VFEKVIKELEKIKRNGIQVPIHPDADGYIDRECPSEGCLSLFKVNADDWRSIFNDESVFCPFCRHEAASRSWFSTEQLEQAHKQAIKIATNAIHNGLVSGAEDFNRKQSHRSFISMKMTVQGGRKTSVILPIKSQSVFEQKVSCEKCSARYAVVGSAYFCPSCGHNSVEKTFQNSIASIITKIEKLPEVIAFLASNGLADHAQETSRSLIESSLSECVTALQRYCDQLYSRLFTSKKLRQNAFQRIETLDEEWRVVFGNSVKDWLTSQEFNDLAVLYQKRHLLQHTQGIVDEKYIKKSGDSTYTVGQRIVCKEADAIRLAKLTSKIGNEIKIRFEAPSIIKNEAR